MTDKKQELDIAEVPKGALLSKFGAKYSVDTEKVYGTLCKTAFRDATSVEQVIALLVVADQYGLNPFTKEIFAFPDKHGGVVPVVGIDGWNRIAQQHPQFDGVELRYSDKISKPSPKAKDCPEWVEAIVYRKDREHPVTIREYSDECFRNTSPWESHTKRMLRHKALIQGYRTAFGFHGIYDQDEAEGFIDVESSTLGDTVAPPSEGRQTKRSSEPLNTALTPPAAQEPESTEGADASTKGIDSGGKPEDDGDGIDI